MRVRWLSVLIVVVASLPVLAHAESPVEPVMPPAPAPATAPSQGASTADKPRPFTYQRREVPPFPGVPAAIGVNNPLGWYRGAIAASLYVGLSPHHAIRASFAYYRHANPVGETASGLAGGDGTSYDGRLIDYGVGLVWYPRRRWEGVMLEAGALLRDREIRTAAELQDVVKNWTLTYAARGMIGYSWRFGRGFAAIAVGLSAGPEVGRERIAPGFFGSMAAVERRVERLQVDGEAYLRLGWVLGG